jgi:hypothetical protein
VGRDAAHGEVDRRVDDRAAGAQCRGFVVDGEQGVLVVLGEDRGECAQSGGAGQLLVWSLSEIRSWRSSIKSTAPWALMFFALAAESPSKVCSA